MSRNAYLHGVHCARTFRQQWDSYRGQLVEIKAKDVLIPKWILESAENRDEWLEGWKTGRAIT